jgi:flagellin
MTRINTNVSSLLAQTNLASANNQLNQALTRLSTGLRINSGKDDPAGLIAANALGSEITSANQAISNTQQATNMIDTANSALTQVSTLLNDIQGLVTQAANTGAMSSDQIAANQSQIDSSLNAIDRIAQTTAFQGTKLLDGSLDFNVGNWAGSAPGNVKNLQVSQANLSNGALHANLDVTTAAAQAELDTSVATGGSAATTGAIAFSAGGTLTLAANANGAAANGYTLGFSETADVTAGQAMVQVSGKNITVYVNNAGTTNLSTIATALNNNATVGGLFTATASALGNGKDVYTVAGGADALISAPTATGTDTGLANDSTFELSGTTGAQVFNFKAGTTITAMEDAINLATGATGIAAGHGGGGTQHELTSNHYGKNAFVNVKQISGTEAFTSGGNPATHATGVDAVATLNGTSMTANGQNVSLNTADLSLSANVAAVGNTTFDVQSGGALFQLGPDVIGSEQAQIGIQSASTGSLGGAAGALYQLGSGQAAALATSPTLAGQIIAQAINQVSSLQGRLGAFEKTTLDSNTQNLTNTVQNLTSAQSSIQDADFAAESANLTRAQVLSQSATAVLSVANSTPQNVLALLKNI